MKFLLAALLVILSTTDSRGETEPVRIDVTSAYTPSDYAFLSPAIGSSRVVALGESIHVTTEMPRVRLQIVRYLHEQMGFNVSLSRVHSWMPGLRRTTPIGTRVRCRNAPRR